MSALVVPREECVRRLRAEATRVLARLALAEAEGRLTEKEAVVVARIRARMTTPAEAAQQSAAA